MGRKAIKTWSHEEITWLRQNAASMSAQKMADHLGRRIGSINSQIRYLGISRGSRGMVRWTPEEDERLKKFLEEFSGRSLAAIAARIRFYLEQPNKTEDDAAKEG